jgi:hypothetical protein
VLVIPSRTHDTNTAYVDFETAAAAQKVGCFSLFFFACCSVPSDASCICVCYQCGGCYDSGDYSMECAALLYMRDGSGRQLP